MGKRDNGTGMEFIRRLRHATQGRFQINTGGLQIYQSVIPMVFGRDQDHAQVITVYDKPTDGEARYSPPEIVDMHVNIGNGKPNLAAASTSYIERSNLTVRMLLRRFTRLTNAFSKSWRHHAAAISPVVGFYNFARPHMTLTE